MKELDVLLKAFVEQRAESLAVGAWPEFEKLLDCEDDRIWDWLQDPAHPDAQCFRLILIEIRGVTAGLD